MSRFKKLETIKKIAVLIVLILSTINTYAQLPDPGFEVDARTAIVITDPQNDFLSPNGVTWGVVGESVKANNTVENLEKLFKVAKQKGITVFVSPHYYFKHDHNWKIEGALEALMHNIKMFDRTHTLRTDGFEGSGADWLDRYKKYINEDNVVVTSPHKVYGPESNDLALQLRKHGYDNIILAGMSSNLCTESHMRDLIESGFKVAVVKDATAGAILPNLNAYEASLVNFQMIASHVFTTKEIVKEIKSFSK
ncbi:cysteine hydrolase [Aquimarina sp. 2201CG5-10]|uniref:cysteine hydrolase n=1 Tax=Aquimarina callyspongiae TaxID=3098150 RepID=UPI002AB5D665|nr:cysteine hydrolase [Aquimarina sp. 2201CG5-10]MDY8138358.1 cysteine hydrolase [Aquimarina sp. 2201CG5-10]